MYIYIYSGSVVFSEFSYSRDTGILAAECG